MEVEVRPLTAERWADFERLSSRMGGNEGCWCMWPRITTRELHDQWGEGNRRAMRAIVDEGRTPGLIAYSEGRPAGWVSVAPRDEFGHVLRSPATKPPDDVPAWGIVCFFIDPDHRGSGLGRTLLAAAVEYAAEHDAEVVEGYPVEVAPGERLSDWDAFHGTAKMFEAAGFVPVIRRREKRPVMRRHLRARSG